MPVPLLEELQHLGSEAAALAAMVERTRIVGSSDTGAARDHRRHLAQVRASIEDRLPEVVAERDRCLRSLEELHRRSQMLRRRLEALDRSDGRAAATEARLLACQLEREYKAANAAAAAAEHELEILEKFLPQARPTAVRPYSWTAAPPVVPHPLPAPPDGRLALEDLAPDLDEPDELDEASSLTTQALLEPSREVIKRATHNKRRHGRHPYIVPLKYRFDGCSFTARSADVSMGGMFVESPSVPALGTNLSVLFCVEGFPVEAEGVVVFVMSNVGFGVSFRHVPDEDRGYLETLLHRLAVAA